MSQSITLSDEQLEFRAVLRQFARDKIAPLAAETDRTAEYSWDAFKALQSMDLTSLSYPVAYGGSGRRSSIKRSRRKSWRPRAPRPV